MERRENKISKRKFIRQCAALSAGMLCLPGQVLLAGTDGEEQNDFRREAMFQEKTARGIMCRICPNECVLKEGELSQCRNRKMRNVPPATSSMGADCWMAAVTRGSLEKVAVRASTGPRPGVAAQTMNQGRSPRTRNTAMRMPQMRNQRRAFSCMVESTSALMMALSTLLTVSKRQSPITVRTMAAIDI